MLLGSLGHGDEVACKHSVTGQQETLFHSYLSRRDNGSGIISFHRELILPVSALLLRNMTCRGDEIQVPGFPSCLPLRDNEVYIQISLDERANVYTVFLWWGLVKRGRDEGFMSVGSKSESNRAFPWMFPRRSCLRRRDGTCGPGWTPWRLTPATGSAGGWFRCAQG